MPASKFFTIDIGRAWTKTFLISLDEKSNVEIQKSLKFPTPHTDISTTTKNLISELANEKLPTVVVSRLKEAEQLAKEIEAIFVHEEKASASLVDYFKKIEKQVVILDAGASHHDTKIETKEIGKYLSFSTSEVALENFLGNKSFRLHTIPVNVRDLEIEEAFYRNLFLGSMANTSPEEKLLLVATGGILSGTPNIYRLAMLLLDILGNGQVAQVYFDREFFLPSFGALLSEYKQLQLSEAGEWLDHLGAFVSLGSPLSVDLNWGYSLQQKIELTNEEIALVPTSRDQKIKLEFTFENKKRGYNVAGGSLGLLFDAREKPLLLSFGQESSRSKVSSWLKQIEESRMAEEAF